MALGQYLSGVPDGSGLDDHWNDAEGASVFLLELAGPEVPVVLRGMSMVLVVLAIKILIAPCGLPRHLIRPFKVWLVLDFLQHPMYWFSEHSIDSLCVDCSGLPYEISHRAVAVISVRPEIPPLLRDNLFFSLNLQLVFFYSFILFDPIHQLAHTGGRLASQRLPQAVLGRETVFEDVDGDIVKVAIHFIIHIPISIRVSLQSFSIIHG